MAQQHRLGDLVLRDYLGCGGDIGEGIVVSQEASATALAVDGPAGPPVAAPEGVLGESKGYGGVGCGLDRCPCDGADAGDRFDGGHTGQGAGGGYATAAEVACAGRYVDRASGLGGGCKAYLGGVVAGYVSQGCGPGLGFAYFPL